MKIDGFQFGLSLIFRNLLTSSDLHIHSVATYYISTRRVGQDEYFKGSFIAFD